MKVIRKLKTPTSGLAEYLKAVGDEANWDEFRSHNSGASYRELREALTQNQRGICAYCEMVIDKWRRQVEHVIPQSDSENVRLKTTDIANMVACCTGGTTPDGDDSYRRPVRYNMSCGQAKGNQIDEDFIDPRTLPAMPSLVRVLDDGRIEADETACQSAKFHFDSVTRTIDILNLNAERLRLNREKWWNGLEEETAQIEETDNPDIVKTWIRSLLTPDKNNRLIPLFTTTRSYFAPLGEVILAEVPQEWI